MTDKEYTSKVQIEEFLRITITRSLDDIILGVQDFIEEYTGTIFRACSVASARYFNGNDQQLLMIDDAVEITKVEIGEDFFGNTFTEVLGTGMDRYLKVPENAVAKNKPITGVLLTERVFLKGIQNQKITAKWGYCSMPPAGIQTVATILAAGIYQNRFGAKGTNSETIGTYQVSYDTQDKYDQFKSALKLLDTYRKFNL